MRRNSPNTGHWRRHGPRMVVCVLPDGRRLVAEGQATKVFDADGDEIESTPEDVAALMAICGMR
jgi:putative hemolysin